MLRNDKHRRTDTNPPLVRKHLITLYLLNTIKDNRTVILPTLIVVVALTPPCVPVEGDDIV